MALTAWITAHWLEIFGALAGIIYVVLEIRQNIWLWPVGIVTSAVYVAVFFTSKFYADMGLQVYYLVISFYGWYFWRYGTRQHPKEDPVISAEHPAISNQQPAASSQQPLIRTETSDSLTSPRMAEADRQPPGSNQHPAISNQQPTISNQQPPIDSQQPPFRTETSDSLTSPRMAEADRQPPGSNQQPATLIVTRTPVRLALKLAAIYVLLHAVMWYVLANHTDSPVAGWDSFTTALSVIATWMLARKYIEHWIIWVVVNIVSMILYIYKGLYPTTVLFLVYTVMAFIGYREWSRDMRSKNNNPEY